MNRLSEIPDWKIIKSEGPQTQNSPWLVVRFSNVLFHSCNSTDGTHLHTYSAAVQGVSYWNEWFSMALRCRRINNFIGLRCPVASGGLHICVLSTSFQKKWHGQASTASSGRVSDISEKLDFWWSIPQKGTGIGHLGARDDQTIRISNFFDGMRLLRSLRPLRLLRLLRSLRLQKF